MASAGSFFNKFLSIVLLLLHLGCFTFTASKDHKPSKKRKLPSFFPSFSSQSCGLKRHKLLYSAWCYIKRTFSPKIFGTGEQAHPTPTPTSARSSQQSLVSMIPPETTVMSDFPRKNPSGFSQESDTSANSLFFPLRNDIFPCIACGEIFRKPQLLEQHQAMKHAVSELLEGDSGKNIVHMIFKMGWPGKEKSPKIQRILKIHNGPKILSRFEEYREFVKAKAARNGVVGRRDERCVADGNELLRFCCSTCICDLGANGKSSVCNQQYCSVCGIIRSGFSPKLDGISTLSASWRAHVAIPEEMEEEFKFMNVKRAMLICRVIAGRVGCDLDEDLDKEDGGFDSVVGRGGNGLHVRLHDEELLVFNPRAVLPCFVIVYTV